MTWNGSAGAVGTLTTQPAIAVPRQQNALERRRRCRSTSDDTVDRRSKAGEYAGMALATSVERGHAPQGARAGVTRPIAVPGQQDGREWRSDVAVPSVAVLRVFSGNHY